MDASSQWSGRRDGVLPSLNVAVEAPTLAKEESCIAPAKVVFGFISIICVDCMGDPTSINYGVDYIELGLAYPDVHTDLNQGFNGKRSNELQ